MICLISVSDLMELIEELRAQLRKTNFSTGISSSLYFNNKLLYTEEDYWVLTDIHK